MLARSFIHLIEAAKACEGGKKESEGDRESKKVVGEKEKGIGEESECKQQLGEAALIASNGPLNVDFAFEVGQATRCIV